MYSTWQTFSIIVSTGRVVRYVRAELSGTYGPICLLGIELSMGLVFRLPSIPISGILQPTSQMSSMQTPGITENWKIVSLQMFQSLNLNP